MLGHDEAGRELADDHEDAGCGEDAADGDVTGGSTRVICVTGVDGDADADESHAGRQDYLYYERPPRVPVRLHRLIMEQRTISQPALGTALKQVGAVVRPDGWRGAVAEGVQEADGVGLAGELADGVFVGPAEGITSSLVVNWPPVALRVVAW